MSKNSLGSNIATFFLWLLPLLPQVVFAYNASFSFNRFSGDEISKTIPYFLLGMIVAYLVMHFLSGRRFDKSYFSVSAIITATLLASITFAILVANPFTRELQDFNYSSGYGSHPPINLLTYFPLLGVIQLLTKKKYYNYIDAKRENNMKATMDIPIQIPIIIVVLFVIALIAVVLFSPSFR